MAKKGVKKTSETDEYRFRDASSPMRPDVGTQPQFKKQKPPRKYRYDDSLAPAMEWDGQNPAREEGEALIAEILNAESIEEAKAAAAKLKAMSLPFLNWAGKAERLSFHVPTLPLFVHERLSTKAIIETLQGHQRDKQMSFDLFGDPQRSAVDQVLHAYEYQDDWVNRMILGDSLVVMNSLLEYEHLGGQVQMIYMDPPYGVKYGSNFQPFVRMEKKVVKHGEDDDLTREPEMVKAYRDTWELGLHSYLTYLRDRLLLCRDLLTDSGSIFVQISDENLHHVRELLDEVFGSDSFCAVIPFRKTGGLQSKHLDSVFDFLLWYAKDKSQVYFQKLYSEKSPGEEGARAYQFVVRGGVLVAVDLEDFDMTQERLCTHGDLTSQGNQITEYTFNGKVFRGGWKTSNPAGLDRLVAAGRVAQFGSTLRYIRYLDDFPFYPINQAWIDTGVSGFASDKVYVVQTNPEVLKRCILMTTRPGDLVFDPTCGSGTAAFVAENWGRRWITCDTSRIPLAIARQRLLTSTFPYYRLADESRGPSAGFVYECKKNRKGVDIGGVVKRVTLGSIANDEPPKEVLLVDRPEDDPSKLRVSGRFWVEATIPAAASVMEGYSSEMQSLPEAGYIERMIEVLRKSPVIQLGGNRSATLEKVRPIAKSANLSAEAYVEGSAINGAPSISEIVHEADEKSGKTLKLSQKPVAILIGPENGAISDNLIYEAWQEAHARKFAHLFVIGFAIQEKARQSIEKYAQMGMGATYVQATMDITMGDLLKNMRSSQIFSVCGLPDIELRKTKDGYEVELVQLNVFDPITMKTDHPNGDDVPAWFLDTDYNGLCFHVSQAFFPRTGAWENLKKALKATHEEDVWDHLAGSVSAPFEAGEHNQIAVKVIDDRGNELMVVKPLSEAKSK
jgi:adenine-specific DNA-methyltransferase